MLEPFNFQNALRHDSLSRTVALPDLPWETPAWKFIFQDDRNMVIDPVRAFSEPPLPAFPGGADELVGEVISEKKRARPVESKDPFFMQAVSHRQDVSWEEKREADLQRGRMKWIGVIRVWPEEWSICQELNAFSMGPVGVARRDAGGVARPMGQGNGRGLFVLRLFAGEVE